MKSSRIAFLLPDKEPYSSKYGGAVARWVAEVNQYLKTDRFTIKVLGAEQDSKTTYPQGSLVRSKVFTFLSVFRSKFPLSFLNKRQDGLLWCIVWYFLGRLNQYEAIILENRAHYALYLRKLGYRGKLLLHLHNDSLGSVDTTYLQNLSKALDGVIGCSQAILDSFGDKCPSLYKRSVVIHNGVNNELFTPEAGSKQGEVLLFVGRLDKGKGIHLLFEVFAELRKKYENLKLWVTGSMHFGGDGEKSSYQLELEELASELDIIDKIDWLGYVDHDKDLPKVFAEATVFCLPSVVPEAFPLVTLEAAFSGTAVVASALGGTKEGMAAVENIVVPEKERFVQVIDKLLSDKEYRGQVEKANYDFVQGKFRWGKIAQDFEYQLMHFLENE
ncbi:glycosyltransferase family 4 protein [Algivirga pacifica]|uniref:Glycosyl transferase family 1 domain-containing protein n=1 Tax=Algivirga pacifica TaxID=1162670 RepID=A0ABP9DJ83_9BACT